jgi:hypothetical protein
MEYRAWISVPGLPVEAAQRWEPLIERLEHEHGEFGPILAWEHDGAQLVLSTDAPNEAVAARDMYHAVAESLRATGLAELYPARVEIVAVPAEQAASAAA